MRITWMAGLIAWATLQAWDSRFFEHYNDGVSYLDMADCFFSGNWMGGFTFHWSPVYPALIALVFKLFRPPLMYEFAALKAVNLAIFLLLLWSFENFLDVFLRFYGANLSKNGRHLSISDWCWIFLGHAVFAYCFLYLNGISRDTPDMMMAFFMFMAAAPALQITGGDNSVQKHVLFGIFSGLAFIAKGSALAACATWLPIFAFQNQHAPRYLQKLLAAIAAAAAIVIPYATCLSFRAGSPTLSAAAAYNYANFVEPRSGGPNVPNNPEFRKTLAHPTRHIYSRPDVFEFSTPLPGTYPPWFDPSYWYQGAKPGFSLFWSAATAAYDLAYYGVILFIPLFVIVGFTCLINGKPVFTLASIAASAGLLASSLAGFFQYALLINLPALVPAFVDRYFGVFVALFILGTLAGMRIERSARGLTALRLVMILTGILLFMPLAEQLLADARCAIEPQSFDQYDIALNLRKSGLRRGDRVALIGREEMLVDWARLARLKIVAEADNNFWEATPQRRNEVLGLLRNYGVKAAVYFQHPLNIPVRNLQESQDYERRLLLGPFAIKHLHASDTSVTAPVLLRTLSEEGWTQLDSLPCWVHSIPN